MLIYDQKNLMARRRATKTVTSLKLSESLHVFTTSPLAMPRRQPKHMKDISVSNEADVLGFARYAPWTGDLSWLMSYKQKREMFGEFHTAVGAQTDAQNADEHDMAEMNDDDDAIWGDIPKEALPGADQLSVNPGRHSKVIRQDSNIEPAWMHSWSIEVNADLVHLLGMRGVVGGTPGSGMMALACLRAGIPYCGICCTDKHKEYLEQHLMKLVFQQMQQEGSGIHDPTMTKLLAATEP